jgi:Caspase domain
MFRVVLRFTVALFIFACFSPAAFAERRVALVIGNSTYAHAGRLANPRNDASDVAAVLTRLGFEVTPVYDTPGADFARAVDGFLTTARGADAAIACNMRVRPIFCQWTPSSKTNSRSSGKRWPRKTS